jgi:hypothetical protein
MILRGAAGTKWISGKDASNNQHTAVTQILSKNGTEIRFDIRIETAKGVLWAACMKRKTLETNAIVVPLSVKRSSSSRPHE